MSIAFEKIHNYSSKTDIVIGKVGVIFSYVSSRKQGTLLKGMLYIFWHHFNKCVNGWSTR